MEANTVRYGINAGHLELRNHATDSVRAKSWSDTVSALGVGLVRTGVYCASLVPGTGCVRPEVDDLSHLVESMMKNPELQYAIVLQGPKGFTEVLEWFDATGTDLRRRAAYFAEFGYAVGRRIADAGVSGQVAYFELGNEPDLAAIKDGAPDSGMRPSDYYPQAVERVRVTVAAMRAGLTEAFADVGVKLPQLAFGVSGIHWGMTDMIFHGTTPELPEKQTRTPVDWDVTVVHWYYDSSYQKTYGGILQQQTGFDIALWDWVDGRNPALQFAEKYGKPIAITEFGIRNNAPEYSGDPAKRATALTRLVAGLTGTAAQYPITDLIAFALTDEPPGDEDLPGWGGKYGLTEWKPALSVFEPRSTYTALQAFVSDPIAARALIVTEPMNKSAIAVPESRKQRFSGTSSPEALITVKGTRSGRIIAEATADSRGDWTAESVVDDSVVFPGVYDVTITQFIGGLTSDPVEVSWLVVTHAVDVTEPIEGSTVPKPDGPIVFRGSGEPDSTITITGQATGRPIATSTIPAGADRSWIAESAPNDSITYAGTYTVLTVQEKDGYASPAIATTWTVAPN